MTLRKNATQVKVGSKKLSHDTSSNSQHLLEIQQRRIVSENVLYFLLLAIIEQQRVAMKWIKDMIGITQTLKLNIFLSLFSQDFSRFQFYYIQNDAVLITPYKQA